MSRMHSGRTDILQACIQAVLALCSAIALALVLPTTAPLHERTNSAVWIFCAVGLFFMIRHACRAVPSARGRIYFLSFGLWLSFVYVLGRYIYLYNEVKSIAGVFVYALLLTPAMAAALATAMRFFSRAATRPPCVDPGTRRAFFDRKHLFLFVLAGMLLCYIPCFLAFFPANINYDIANQTRQAVTEVYSTNHPLLHTLFIKGCLEIGLALWNSYTNGFMVYAVLQTLLLTACFSYSFCCIVRLVPRQTAFHWIVLLLFALYPTNHLFAITTTKDVLASGAFLVSLSALCMLLFNAPKPFCKSWTLYLLFVLSSILAMLLRNGVVYAYLAAALCILLFAQTLWVRLLLPSLLSIGMFFGASAALKAGLHAGGGNPAEMLAVPLQQIVNANIYHPECFTQEEQALFDDLIETKWRYLPQIVDPIKEFIDKDVLWENRDAYWKLYLSIGKKAPAAYLNAFLILNLGIWYPDEITHADVHTDDQGYVHTSDWFYVWDEAPVSVEKHSYLPAVEKLYEMFSMGNIHQKIPVISMLFSPGFICWSMFVPAILLLYRRRFSTLLAFVPLLAYWIGLLFAPCIYIRYIYPIIVCMPLLFALTLRAFSTNSGGGQTEPEASSSPVA